MALAGIQLATLATTPTVTVRNALRAGIQPEDQLTILALVNLGVTMMQGTKRKASKKTAGQQDATYDVSRYVPPLKRLMEEV